MRQKDNHQYSLKSEKVQQFFQTTVEEQGKLSGFVQRRSKMTAKAFTETLVTGMMENGEAPLNELIQVSADLGVEISETGLHLRMNESAVKLLKSVLASSLKEFAAQGQVPVKVLEQFSRVDILDSSQVILPAKLANEFEGFNSAGAEAALKMQLSLDYLKGRVNAVQIGPGREPDQKCDLAVQLARAGSLQLFDMGYAELERLRRIGQKDAFYITRLKTQTNVYLQADDDEALDLAAWLDKQAQGGDTVDVWVYVGAEARLPVRLVAQRLPSAVVEERRRKARKNARKKKRGVTQRHLRLLAWNLIITNVPTDRLTADQVALLYRVRWQIELFFKLCKSQFRLAAIGPWRLERVLCQLYARLIGIVLFQWLIAPWRFLDDGELSPPKAHRVVRRQLPAIRAALYADGNGLDAIFAQLEKDFLRYALKTPRKKSPSTFDLLDRLTA